MNHPHEIANCRRALVVLSVLFLAGCAATCGKDDALPVTAAPEAGMPQPPPMGEAAALSRETPPGA